SGPRAEIRFWGIGNQDGVLTVYLAAPRPSGQAHVQVLGNGQLLGEIQPDGEFRAYSFPVTRATIGVDGNLIVTLAGDTFTQPPDDRALGLQIDSARFQSQGLTLPAPAALYLIFLTLLLFAVGWMWSGNMILAAIVAEISIPVQAFLLVVARAETIWFSGSLLWFSLGILFAAWLLSYLLRRLTPAISPRTVRLLFAVMALALGVRMIFAVGPGFIVDTQDYVVWAYKTVTYGLGSAYTSPDGLWIADQSPGLVYILHTMGNIYHAVFSPDFLYPGIAGDPALRGLTTNPAALADPVQRTLLRVPALVCDLLTGALLFAMARQKRSERISWLVALGYWFNPAVLWNGAYWGQTDAIPALLVLLAFLLMENRRMGWAFFVIGAGAVTKPQAAVFGPLLLLWAARELLAAYPLRREYAGRILRGIAPAVAGGAIGVVLVLLPMILAGGLDGMVAYFGDTVGHHPILSANAHNLWWVLKDGQIDLADTGRIDPNIPLSYRTLSLLLFGGFYLATLVKAWFARREDLFAIGAFVGFCFFMLPTEIHENYGYSLLPLLAVALTRNAKWLWVYLAVTVTMVLNYALSDPPVFAWLGIDDPVQQLALARQLNATANLLLFGAWSLYLLLGRTLHLRQAVPAPDAPADLP
ncbi:MAG: glycosyltransferase 87 family protein, partial [Anaerolineae bacterium]